jgi:uncharacterized protein YebE (UPF0316 family)
MNLLVSFIIFNVINVVVQTIKSIATIKCGKSAAAIINALAYGFYTYIVVLTMCELPLLVKCLVVAGCNFIGVYVVKYIEEKMRKDKLWKVEATTIDTDAHELALDLERAEMSFNFIDGVGKYVIFNIFCETQADSHKAKEILDHYNAKYFVSESKTLA